MKKFISGDCHADKVFHLADPSQFSEIEFESEVVKALTCLLPEYDCGVFAGSFVLEGERRSADLALLHKSLSHWFVVEVELDSHSLNGHILPQVRCFRYGRPENTCITSLCRAFSYLNRTQAEDLLEYVPMGVAIVANRRILSWEEPLNALDVQLLTVSVFRDAGGATAHGVEGTLNVWKESLGFAQYSATDQSLRIARNCGLKEGTIQIQDQFGEVAIWEARATPAQLWITKLVGSPMLEHNSFVQVVRTHEGRVMLRPSQ